MDRQLVLTTRRPKFFITAALLVLLCGGVSGCYTPEEFRARAASMPDPRQKMLSGMWDALLKVASEEKWDIELAREQDLILTTAWRPVDASLRKRIRCLIIKTPQAVGLNATVTYQRLEQTTPEEVWIEAKSSELSKQSQREEREIVQRIYDTWELMQ